MNFNLHEVKLEYGTLPNHSTEALYAYIPRAPCPIGFIYYSQILHSSIVDIHYIFVHERYRRRGVATRMLEQLRVWYPRTTIHTDTANEFSEGWLRLTGFVLENNGWFLRPQIPEPCPMI